MKLSKILCGLVAIGGLTFASCSDNDYPTFSDADAFVAFTNSSLSIGEAGDSIEVPVLLTSLSGIETDVEFEIDTATTTAVEGVNFKIEGAKKLHFTKNAPEQKIVIKVIDNNTFDGDVKVGITLKMNNKVKLGASKSCSITLEDDEHPLLFILGTFSGVGESGFGGDIAWQFRVEKDPDGDLTKVWFSNLVPGGSSLKVYGTVNEEKTEIHIPVDQEIAASSSYPHIMLKGFYGEDGDEDIPTGGYVTVTIDADGNLTFLDWFGSQVFDDDAATHSLGWYEIVMGGATGTKN